METNSETQGLAIVFAGPSGAGKSTIAKSILNEFPQTAFSRSATNRKIRSNEVSHRDYYFLESAEEFQKKVENGEFVEWQEVYEGTFYGTLKIEVQRLWKEGKVVIFDVDVEGAMNLKEIFGKNVCTIFVGPPSREELERRLRSRSTESEEDLKKRLLKADHEMGYQKRFDQILINDDLETSKVLAKSFVYHFLDLMRD